MPTGAKTWGPHKGTHMGEGQPCALRRGDKSQEYFGQHYLVIEISWVIILLRPDDEWLSCPVQPLPGRGDRLRSQAPGFGGTPLPSLQHPPHQLPREAWTTSDRVEHPSDTLAVQQDPPPNPNPPARQKG